VTSIGTSGPGVITNGMINGTVNTNGAVGTSGRRVQLSFILFY